MRSIRKKDTRPELAVRRLLHAMGARFRLHRADLPGTPDIVLPRHAIAIQVHGCFWHQHPGCIDAHIPKSRENYWRPKLERNCRRDAVNVRKLRRLGWRICVVWECQAEAPEKLKTRLYRFLNG